VHIESVLNRMIIESKTYKKHTKTEIKAVQEKRRSGGKNLIYRVYSINKIILLILNYHK